MFAVKVPKVVRKGRFELPIHAGFSEHSPGQRIDARKADRRQFDGVRLAQERAFRAWPKNGGVSRMSRFGIVAFHWRLFRQFQGRVPKQLAMPAQLWSVQTEFSYAAIHDRGGRADIPLGIRQLRQLPQEPAVCRQPQGQLLGERRRVGGELLLLPSSQLPGFVFACRAHKANPKELVQVLCCCRLVLAEAYQFELVFLGLLKFAGSQPHGLLQPSHGLREVALQLPGGTEVRDDPEMLRVVALSGSQQLHCLHGLTEANIECTLVGELIRVQFPFAASFLQFAKRLLVLEAQRTGRRRSARFDGNGSQGAVIQKKATPLRWQLVALFARVVQACAARLR